METTIGSISLELLLNSKSFEEQLNGVQTKAKTASDKISNSFAKIGTAIAAAFEKACIDLGSDLAEVQNVVDVTFSKMSGKVDEWSKKAANSFGLSETMAKKYVGTFGSQLNGVQTKAKTASDKISNSFAKIGTAIAAAFSVKVITSFGKACIDLGSDLAEVQNVVDVTFSKMSGKVDEWSKKAANSFGLSETMAKKYVGTFGSMAEAFGFSEKEAYDMSTTLTGLTGDVASFYNLDQDLAYTKLKSVFSGETETLKDLGIVMTQTALDSYAMSNGFGKTTKSMTEAEKVTLRYKFVQEQLKNATGDFLRTQDGWANQTRVVIKIIIVMEKQK